MFTMDLHDFFKLSGKNFDQLIKVVNVDVMSDKAGLWGPSSDRLVIAQH